MSAPEQVLDKRRAAVNKYKSHLESIYSLLGKEFRELSLQEVQTLIDLSHAAETDLKEAMLWDGVVATSAKK
jgi:hypothetical protein